MRIVYIHQYFLKPSEGGAVRSYYLARGLVKAGATVDVITAHNENFYDIQIVDGIRVHYLPIRYDNHYGFFRRVLAFARFVKQAQNLIVKLPYPDLLYITSTPLTTGLIGIWAKHRLALPFVFEVRDLWPQAPIEMGVIRNPLFKSALRMVERRIYHHAMKLVALSPGISSNIGLISPGKQVALIPNFADTHFFRPDPATGVSDSVTISYIGAIGKVNGLDRLLDLANVAQAQGKNWRFDIMGKGADTERLTNKMQEMGLSNVRMLPFGDKRQVRQQLLNSHIAYISFLPLPVLETSSPNKFFDALAMGLPILLNFRGWLLNLVEEHGIGAYHGDEGATIRWIEEVASDRQKSKEIQQIGRQLAEKHFSVDTNVNLLKSLLLPGINNQDIPSGAGSQTA